jgi:hypothetical protein
MTRFVLLGFLLTGCVVKQYGAPVAAADAGEGLAPVDFSKVEAELETLIAAEREDVDRRDRLEAAWKLIQRVKTERPAAQHVVEKYLVTLLELEKRGRDDATGAIAGNPDARFTPITQIQGEDIAVEEAPPTSPSVTAQLPVTAGANAIMDAARRRMNGNDLAGAMAQLEVCKDQPCWAQVGKLWSEVRDRVVYQAQDRAGRIFMAAQALQDKQVRLAKLQEARGVLADIQKRYPGSRYEAGIADKIKRVDAAISETIAN